MTLSNLASSGLYKVQTGLVGIGNWASVTATTGTPTTGTYTDSNGVGWKYYRWTAAGSVTVTAGVLDVLVAAGGAGSTTSDNEGGSDVLTGIFAFTSSTHTVTIGAAGPGGNTGTGNWNNQGGASSIGSVSSGLGPIWRVNSITSTITGASVTYGEKVLSPAANLGQCKQGATGSGGSGVVIIRVPSVFALA